MTDSREAAYCTLLMSDDYLPGAMVLAHSLRDNGTKAKLVVLATVDSLRTATVEELKTIYDDVVPINRIANVTPDNLYLMNRPDLVSTFSKIELWRQSQYRQIVYLDADVVALRAPDELLSLDTHFAAVPDIGWPDCFNTGVMVLRPNLQDYYALLAFAKRGISFDGADQGLLNMHFRNWDRLSFTYNCTPSGHYQYVPAFRHFQGSISLVHYIGLQKPWNLPRKLAPVESPYSELLGRWWAVYDRHYGSRLPTGGTQKDYGEAYTRQRHPIAEGSSRLSSITSPGRGYDNEGEASLSRTQDVTVSLRGINEPQHPQFFQPSETTFPSETATAPLPLDAPPETETGASLAPAIRIHQPEEDSYSQSVPLSSTGADAAAGANVTVSEGRQGHLPALFASPGSPAEPRAHSYGGHTSKPVEPSRAPTSGGAEVRSYGEEKHSPETPTEGRRISPPRAVWDASRGPPPVDSKPEAANLTSRTYTMSTDTDLFQPPKSYPDAPKEAHQEPPVEEPPSKRFVFPWEQRPHPPARIFLNEDVETRNAPSLARMQGGEVQDEQPSVPAAPSPHVGQSDVPIAAWDCLPAMEKYVESVQPRRKASIHIDSVSPPMPSSSGDKDTEFRGAEERLNFPIATSEPIGILKSQARTKAGTGKSRTRKVSPDEEDWMYLTTNGFINLLRIINSYWSLTETQEQP